MSFATTRAALATWIGGSAVGALEPGVYTGSSITGLYTTRTAMPREIPDEDFSRGATLPWLYGAAAVVFLDRAQRFRVSYGGWGVTAAGKKRIDYTATIALTMRSQQESAEDAQTSWDGIVNGIISRIETDPTLNGAVWSAGEGSHSQAGFDVQWGDLAVMDGATMQLVAAVILPVTEWVNA